MPGAFSDDSEDLAPFTDSTSPAESFQGLNLDTIMMNLMMSGTVSGSTQCFPPDLNCLPTYTVVARHGFVFSQNDNFGYDSIAFGGWKK